MGRLTLAEWHRPAMGRTLNIGSLAIFALLLRWQKTPLSYRSQILKAVVQNIEVTGAEPVIGPHVNGSVSARAG